MKIILRIIGIALAHKWYLIGAYFSLAGSAATYLLLPRYFGQAIDRVSEGLADGGTLAEGEIMTIGLIILGLSVIRGALSYFQTFLGEALSQLVAYDIRNKFYDHVQHLSFGFHDKHHTGNLMSRAITDVENIRMFINMGVVRTPYFLILFVVVAVVLMVMDWQLGLLSTSFLPFVAFNSGMVRLKMRLIWLRVQEKMADLNTVLQENLTGVRVVKAFAAEEHEETKYNARSADVASEMVDAEKLRASNTAFTTFTFYVSLALILWFGGWRVMNGAMSPGELAQFIFYMQILAMPVRMTGWLVNAYARAASAGQRLFEILDTQTQVKEKPDA
ncbi:MAG: ABC transporter ATP-binding protein, partial [Chloroflexi bacterium]|nr:ABC transporter ATP-binding protein [Chloroflexota bacterium]